MAALFVGPAPVGRASAEHPHFDEWDFLNLANRERRAAGLGPLAMVDGAREVARNHSGVMALKALLHHNPDFSTQLRRVYSTANRVAENVGTGGSTASIHGAFMNSASHRANILGAFGYVGMGVRWENGRMWATQNFVNQAAQLPFTVRVPLTRLFGASDPDTSVLLSRRLAAGSAGAAVLATSAGFADALAGSPLAAANRGPLLLSPPEAAPQNVIDEIRRVLQPEGRALILGGPAALSPHIETQLAAAGVPFTRLAGQDRFGTAAAVAQRVNPMPTEIMLVSGLSFADAVVAGPPAGSRRAPVLLVAPNEIPPATSLYLASQPTADRFLIGGPAAASEAVRQAARAERVFGPDRYATSVSVAQKFFGAGNRLALASGGRYQDALVASAEAGRDGFPVILSSWPLPDPTYDYVGRQAGRWVFALVVGRPSDLPDQVVVQALS